jgi:hypothetical protein
MFVTFGRSRASTPSPYIHSPAEHFVISLMEESVSIFCSKFILSIPESKPVYLSAFTTWLKSMNISGMPAPSASKFSKVAIAFSEGVFRAMCSGGGGVFDALDS